MYEQEGWRAAVMQSRQTKQQSQPWRGWVCLLPLSATEETRRLSRLGGHGGGLATSSETLLTMTPWESQAVDMTWASHTAGRALSSGSGLARGMGSRIPFSADNEKTTRTGMMHVQRGEGRVLGGLEGHLNQGGGGRGETEGCWETWKQAAKPSTGRTGRHSTTDRLYFSPSGQ